MTVSIQTTLATALFVTMMPLAGCKRIQERMAQKAVEKALEESTGGKVDIDGKGLSIKGADGKGTVAVGAGATLPKDFPKDVPIYPGAKVVVAIQSNDKDKTGYMVSLESKDAPAKIAAYYKANLKGFTQSVDMNTGDSYTLAMTKESTGTSMTMSAASSGTGDTSITLGAQTTTK